MSCLLSSAGVKSGGIGVYSLQPNRPTEIPLARASCPHLPTPLASALCFSSVLFPPVHSGPVQGPSPGLVLGRKEV